MPTCSNCRFYRERNSSANRPLERGKGTCRRHAPSALALDVTVDQARLAVWPMLDPDEWCGEYEDAKQPAKAGTSHVAQALREQALPSAKEAVVMIREYMEEIREDFDSADMVVQSQQREGDTWRVQLEYDGNNYEFTVGPNGIVEMA